MTVVVQDLIELAERCEKATGPDRELDLAIHLALWPDGDVAKITRYPRCLESQEGYAWTIAGESVVYEKWVGGRCPVNGGYPLLRYTGSLDAAMTLLEESVDIEMSRDAIKPGGKLWCVYLSAGDRVQTGFIPILTRADTGPLALCAAALRARASLKGEG